MEQKQIAYHERVRAGYLAMAADEPDRWVTIDATGDIGSVQSAIREPIMRHLVRRGFVVRGSPAA